MSKTDRKTRIFRFLIFLGFTLLGALFSWILFDFRPPGGTIIMMGSMAGYVISLAAFSGTSKFKAPLSMEFRDENQWPLIRKAASLAFFVFFGLAGLFSSPRIIQDDGVRKEIFLILSGLGLLGGTPIMFALKSRLKLLGFFSLFISLMLVATGLLGALQVKTSHVVKMALLFLGTAFPLILILVCLRRRRP